MQLGCSAVVGLLACQFGCGFVGLWMLLYCLVYFSGKNRNEVEERERVGEDEREMINKWIVLKNKKWNVWWVVKWYSKIDKVIF